MSRTASANRDKRLLDLMQPGVILEAKEIAAAVGMSVPAARNVLDRLEKAGRVARVKPLYPGLAVGWKSGKPLPTSPSNWHHPAAPRNPVTVDRERRVLEAMTPGLPYQTPELAAATGLTLVQTRDALERMVRRNKMVRISQLARSVPSTWRRV